MGLLLRQDREKGEGGGLSGGHGWGGEGVRVKRTSVSITRPDLLLCVLLALHLCLAASNVQNQNSENKACRLCTVSLPVLF